MTKPHVLLVGGTGLIGSQLVAQFDGHGADLRMTALGRRGLAGVPVGIEQVIAPIDQWDQAIAELEPDILVSCLGSTMKKAGSKESFAAIDRDLVARVAIASKAAGAKQAIAISSTMANSDASSFYLKVKGQAEDALRAQGFDRLDIIRPGLLRGERTDDWRLGESLAIVASPVMDMLLHGSLRRYRSIAAKDIARAIYALMGFRTPGAFVHENDAIWQMV